MKKLRIGFLLPRYTESSRSFMPAVVQAVAESGVVVDVIHPVDRVVDLSEVRVEHDLYILRHTSGLSLSLAGALHQLGAMIVKDRKSTRLNSSHSQISYAVFCLKKKKQTADTATQVQ